MLTLKVESFSEDEVVFSNPEDASTFYSELVENGRNVFLTWIEDGFEIGKMIKTDFGTRITDGKTQLLSKRKVE